MAAPCEHPGVNCASASPTLAEAARAELRNPASRFAGVPRDMFDAYLTQRYLARCDVAGSTHVATRATPMRLAHAIPHVDCVGMCVLPDGDLCVADRGWRACPDLDGQLAEDMRLRVLNGTRDATARGSVRRFAADGTERRAAAFHVRSVRCVCLTRTGRLAVGVCDRRSAACIRIYTVQGTLCHAFIVTRPHDDDDDAVVPCSIAAIALDRDGNLVMADTQQLDLRIFTEAGMLLRDVFFPSCGCIYKGIPDGLAVCPSTGGIFVADASDHRVVQLTRELELVTAWTVPDTTDAWRLESMSGVCLDADRNLFVLADGAVQVRTAAGAWLPPLGAGGRDALAPNFSEPGFVAIDVAGRLYASDLAHHRVLVFE